MKFYPQQCPYCKTVPVPMELDQELLYQWMDGTVIQKVFPEMTVNDRELMITGIHSECWDAMFKEKGK